MAPFLKIPNIFQIDKNENFEEDRSDFLRSFKIEFTGLAFIDLGIFIALIFNMMKLGVVATIIELAVWEMELLFIVILPLLICTICEKSQKKLGKKDNGDEDTGKDAKGNKFEKYHEKRSSKEYDLNKKFEKTLKNAKKLKKFREFLVAEMSAEELDFYLICRELKTAEKMSLAQNIFDEFIAEESAGKEWCLSGKKTLREFPCDKEAAPETFKVNVSYVDRERIKQFLRAGRAEPLYRVYRKMAAVKFCMLRDDKFLRFCETKNG